MRDTHLWQRIGAPLALLLLVLAAAPVAGSAPHVSPLVVNTTDDTNDGTCNSAHCSLREALAAASANARRDIIYFSIPRSDPGYDPATGAWTIRAGIPFDIPPDTTVDGTLGAYATGDPKRIQRPGIEITGPGPEPGYTGLYLFDRVTLRGLIVNRWQYGIWVAGDNVTVEFCYVGTDPLGTTAKPNGLDGILIANGTTGATIQDNLLSGNRGDGLRIFGAATTGNTIRRNQIGTDASGTAPLPNSRGIYIHANAHHNTIGPGNLIAFNILQGIRVDGSATLGNTLTMNSIHDNGGKGIQLIGGGNAALAAPVIGTVTQLQAAGTACPGCVVEIYSDKEDEGAVYEGSTTADAGGHWSFTSLTGLTGPNITATATDSAGNTSEFSAPARPTQAVFLPAILKGFAP